ncbi:hypothetical protein PENTCL1PPCAC_7999, partial [Pristionchus entomophagus]
DTTEQLSQSYRENNRMKAQLTELRANNAALESEIERLHYDNKDMERRGTELQEHYDTLYADALEMRNMQVLLGTTRMSELYHQLRQA